MNFRLSIFASILILTLLIPFDVFAKDTSEEDQWEEVFLTEDLFRNHGSVMLIIDPLDGQIVDANNAALIFYGYDYEEMTSMNISMINTLTEKEISDEMKNAVNEERNFFRFVHIIGTGEAKNVEVYSYPIEVNGATMLYSIIFDTTDKMMAEANYKRIVAIYSSVSSLLIILLIIGLVLLLINAKKRREIRVALEESEQGFQDLFNNMHEGYALHEIITDSKNNPIDFRYLQVNRSFEIFTGKSSSEIIGKRALEVFPETEKYWIDHYGDVALKGINLKLESYSQELDRYYAVNVYNAGYGKFITVFIDITDKKIIEDEIHYLSFHDQLTSLYNRRYMEKSLIELDIPRNLPISLIMIDVNGLKLANDAFGHHTGDQLLTKSAEVFHKVFRDSDIIARIGGDEFLILLPSTTVDVVNKKKTILKEYASEVVVGPIKLSFSVGSATKINVYDEIQTVYKRAEDQMYHEKLTESKKIRQDMIQQIFKKVTTDYQRINTHQNRVAELAMKCGKLFGLSEEDIYKLITASRYHDVGYIAIDNKICDKEEKLSEDELHEIRRHVECGFRILQAISEYSETADIVLAHHEWYNGSGYPKSLSGKDIPKLSRILNILDSFDAMTSHRIYKPVYSVKEAIDEMNQHRGTQFDPDLLDLFINGYAKKHLDGDATI